MALMPHSNTQVRKSVPSNNTATVDVNGHFFFVLFTVAAKK